MMVKNEHLSPLNKCISLYIILQSSKYVAIHLQSPPIMFTVAYFSYGLGAKLQYHLHRVLHNSIDQSKLTVVDNICIE